MPSNITDASNSSFSFAEETTWGVLPSTPDFKYFRFTGESLSSNLETTESETINSNPALSDIIPTNANAGGDVNFEMNYSDEMDIALAHALRATWNGNELKAGNEFKSLTLRKSALNEGQSLIYDYSGSRVNTLSFSITADEGVVTSTLNFASKVEYDRYGYFVWQDDVNPLAVYGRDEAIWINETTGNVYRRTTTLWNTTTPIGTLVSGATWLSGAVDPTTEGSDDDWYLNTASGEHFKKVTGSWVSQFTFKPTGSSWTATDAAPSGGSKGDLHLKRDDGAIYQKLDDGTTAGVWTIIANYKLTSVANFYTGQTYTSASTSSVLNIPQLRNIVVTAEGTQCFKDLSFNIENNVRNINGMCTDTTTYPDLESKAANYGQRRVTGNMTLLLADNELYRKFKAGTDTTLEFTLSNGTSGYKFEFHKIKFTTGNVNITGNNTEIECPLEFAALLDSVEETELTITKVPTV